MTTTVKVLLEAHQRLSDPERVDFAFEFLKRMGSVDLDDEDLARIADEAFLDLDVREAVDGCESM